MSSRQTIYSCHACELHDVSPTCTLHMIEGVSRIERPLCVCVLEFERPLFVCVFRNGWLMGLLGVNSAFSTRQIVSQ